MAEAPQRHIPAWKKEADQLPSHRPAEDRQQRGGDGLYQSYRYIKFRESVKAERRAADEKRVHQIYQESSNRSFKEYIHFLQDDNPLCVDCLEDERIQPGRVMDHKIPIEKGGSAFDRTNLQFLCDYHHNIKRATTDKQ